ncbi:MAG: DUF4258 domain-containing protein [Bacteriovoracaceae bacterium]|nr:DUF4258 domain-containing protein [Bacteriovoracaceae bacterium]
MNKEQARKVLSEIFNTKPYNVSFSNHSRKQMKKRSLMTGDIVNVLHAGKILSEPEVENGT